MTDVVRGKALGRAASSILESLILEARSSYAAFARFVLRDHLNQQIELASIHRVMHAHVEHCWATGIHPGVLAPFDHGKTISLVVGRIAYELGLNPGLRIKIISNNDTRAMERVMGVATILRSPAYRLVFPRTRPVPPKVARAKGVQSKWTQHEIFLDRPGQAIDPSLMAAGVLSGGTGGRSDLNVYDDCVDHKNAIEHPEERQKVYEAIENVWTQRLEPDARVLYVGTPWHVADATAQLIKSAAYSFLKAAISEDFKRIDLAVSNPTEGYPIPRFDGRVVDGGWRAVSDTRSRIRQLRISGDVIEAADGEGRPLGTVFGSIPTFAVLLASDGLDRLWEVVRGGGKIGA